MRLPYSLAILLSSQATKAIRNSHEVLRVVYYLNIGIRHSLSEEINLVPASCLFEINIQRATVFVLSLTIN